MYKIADNPERREKCLEYLQKKNIANFDKTAYFYIERDGKIRAIAGYNPNFGSIIDPFSSESGFDAMNLFSFVVGFLSGKGYDFISVISQDEKVRKILMRYGFKKHFDSEIFLVNEL